MEDSCIVCGDTVTPESDGGVLYGVWGYSDPRDGWRSPVWCTVIQWLLRRMEESCMVYGDTVASKKYGGVLYGKAVTTKADCYYFSKLETRENVKKLGETYKHGICVF